MIILPILSQSDLDAAMKEAGGLKSAVAHLTSDQASVRAELDSTKVTPGFPHLLDDLSKADFDQKPAQGCQI